MRLLHWAVLPLVLAACADAEPHVAAEVSASADTLPLAERQAMAGIIAFVSERDGDPEVYLVRPPAEAERRLTRSAAADYPAAPAPDGSALVVVSVRETEAQHLEELTVHPLGPGSPVRLGPRSGRARSPSWSPDGRWLVFESDQAGFRDLVRIARRGDGADRLTRDPEGSFDPAVSPDGEWIAYVSSRDGNAEVYRMRVDGTGAERLTAFHRDDGAPRWSPDGGLVAFLSNREGRDRVFLMRPDGSGQRRLGGVVPDTVDEAEPVWSPDGRRIALVRRSPGGARIVVVDVRTGAEQALTDGSSRDDWPAWSPDGRHLAFASDRAGDLELFLMRADGSAPTRLTRARGADWLPRWISTPR